MKILKLPWLSHRAENKTVECYALDINRSSTKLASGGLDGKVKVWDLVLILACQNTDENESESLVRRMEASTARLERPLASMSRHNGVVTCVKFSPDGRFLASGLDDKIVLIWEKDDESTARPKQFGETEPDLEHWTVRKRLVAHDNDVQDICWSPDGQLLITVGLDRSIVIWSGSTFERIKRYDIHQSMVKGVVFDPANKFFATALDDRTVRVFRYHRKYTDLALGAYEFQMEHTIVDPLRKSPLTSYFRRMSWSPDGQHIAVPNATNGPVTLVAIVNRGTWAADVSLIGHEAPCEVVAFAPRLFQLKQDPDSPPAAILASAGQDRTLAIWSTSLPKPLAVAHDIVRGPITDLAWSPDARLLFISSLDGSITCVCFEALELGWPVSGDAIGSLLERYGGDRDSAIVPESAVQLHLEQIAKSAVPVLEKAPSVLKSVPGDDSVMNLEKPGILVSPKVMPSIPTMPTLSKSVSGLPGSPHTRAKKYIAPAVVVTKGGRKRVAPTLISTYSGASKPPISGNTSGSSGSTITKTFKAVSKLSHTPYSLPKLGLATAVHGRRRENDIQTTSTGAEPDADNDNEDMGFDDPNSNLLQTLTAAAIRLKVKKFRKQLMARKYPTPFKTISNLPEVLFSNQQIMNGELATLVQSDKLDIAAAELVNTTSLDSIDESLYFRVLVNATEHQSAASFDDDAVASTTKSHTKSQPKAPLTRSVIEVRNGPAWPEDDEILNTDPIQRTDFQDPTQVIVTNTEHSSCRSYVLYFPFKIQHAIPIVLDHQLLFYVLISFEGLTQIIRASTGSYYLASFELGANVISLKQRGAYFMLLTSLGQLFSFKFPLPNDINLRFEKILAGISVAPVLNAELFLPTNPDKSHNSVHVDNISEWDIDARDGLPVVVVERTGIVYTYSQALMAWTKALDPWYLLAYDKTEVSDLEVQNLDPALVAAVADSRLEKIQRGEADSYRFNEKNNELRKCMRTRFEELVAL